jgi:hypothetical protein
VSTPVPSRQYLSFFYDISRGLRKLRKYDRLISAAGIVIILRTDNNVMSDVSSKWELKPLYNVI